VNNRSRNHIKNWPRSTTQTSTREKEKSSNKSTKPINCSPQRTPEYSMTKRGKPPINKLFINRKPTNRGRKDLNRGKGIPTALILIVPSLKNIYADNMKKL
jgi:hypothetical protein